MYFFDLLSITFEASVFTDGFNTNDDGVYQFKIKVNRKIERKTSRCCMYILPFTIFLNLQFNKAPDPSPDNITKYRKKIPINPLLLVSKDIIYTLLTEIIRYHSYS